MMQTIRNPERARWAALSMRPLRSETSLVETVRPIFEAVEFQGDEAVRRYTESFDQLSVDPFEIPREEIEASTRKIEPRLRGAIDLAARNIERFHAAQLRGEESVEVVEGVRCWRRHLPIRTAGLYVPGGSAPLFSTALMLTQPAKLAGCAEIVVCTPPRRDGTVHPAILYAAGVLGSARIFRVGGAQAIAAMALGTESIPRVDKIFGPGNQYVTAAKQLACLGGIAIDLPAGPSEVMVVADAGAIPDFIAADLLSQAEHGADSHAVLVTDDEGIAEETLRRVRERLAELPRRSIAEESLRESRCVILRDMQEAIAFANEYAPEHLILACERPRERARAVVSAGSVFLGPWAPESVGDYASGTNHTLPTNGAARGWSGVSVDSFLKAITFQELEARGLRTLAAPVIQMAQSEGLYAHAEAVRVRLDWMKESEA